MIHLYLTTNKLYSFLLLLLALIVSQLVKHFMVRRTIGLRIHLNFPNNEYNKKAANTGIFISTITQIIFMIIGALILVISFQNVSLCLIKTTVYKLNFVMPVTLLGITLLCEFLLFRRTHAHILLLISMDRAPVPVVAPN